MTYTLEPTTQLLLHFVDDNGKHATSSYNLDNSETDPAAGGALAISDAAAALSASALYETEILIRAVNPTPGDPTNGAYARPADKLALTLAGSDGTRPRIEIGSPTETDFVDGWNWDTSDTNISNLVAALKTNGRTASGGTITGVTNGQRRRPPRRKGQ